MNSFNHPLVNQLARLSNAEKADRMKAYMKNQFDFLGIPTPERRRICQEHIKRNRIETAEELQGSVKELWDRPQREFQYCAIEVFASNKKLWQQAAIGLIEQCITSKSWWDTVDFISTECSAVYFKIFPGQISTITTGWNRSENIWLQRSSLLFQKPYKNQTDTRLLADFILHLARSKEFFVQKAIGWILREYAKTNPEWVKTFVNENRLAPLSRREALKHL